MTTIWGGDEQIRVLMLEDNADDVKLAESALKAGGFSVQMEVARSRTQFLECMANRRHDLILCDFKISGWNGLAALRWVRSSGFTTPFIYLSGSPGEDIAVECMKEGATDYLIKGKTGRLPVIVRRALQEEKLRTDHERAQKNLHESEQRFATAFRSTPEGMTISTLPDGRYLEANDAFLAMVGYPREKLIGETASNLGIWVNLAERTALLNKLREHETVRAHEATFRTADGKSRDVQISAERVRLQGRSCLLAVIRDVSEWKLLEQQLRQAQKMEAIGRLAGGIAHDFNNLLMVISSSADLIGDCHGNFDCALRYAGQIRSASNRAASLTRQLLAFSRQQILQPSVLSINDVVNDLIKMLPRLLGEDIEIVLALDPATGNVNADRGQLEQVIMNLAINARDAMPHGGKLTIETTNVELDSAYAEARHVKVDAGPYVMIAISDTGTGMTEEVKSHLFEPFFTTKELGKGTGLGLATVYGIVKQSGGLVWPYSELEHGSTFKVYLPRSQRQTETQKTKAGESSTGGNETILLAEDETQLRAITAEYLTAQGYRVLQAADGPAALQISESFDGVIDVLIADVVMPGFGGPKLAEALRSSRPNIRVILVSGYTDQFVRATDTQTQAAFLQKPFGLNVLARKIRSSLDRNAA